MEKTSNTSYWNDIDGAAWTAIKLLMSLSIFAEAFLSGVLILQLKRRRLVSQAVLRVLGSFATGLVLAGGLVDVLPDALSAYGRHAHNFQLPLLVLAATVASLLLADKSLSVLAQARKRARVRSLSESGERLLAEEGGGDTHPSSDLLHGRWYVSLVVLAGLSIHSLFEGIGMGAARTRELLLSIYAMIILHKGFVAASLAIVLLHSAREPRFRFYALMLVFSGMSGLGGVVGVVLGRLEGGAWMVDVAFNCIAAGTFVYIALRELVPQFLEQTESGVCVDLCKLFMFLAGFIFLVSVILSLSLYGT